jgi:thiamine biosynthesis lipoprotein
VTRTATARHHIHHEETVMGTVVTFDVYLDEFERLGDVEQLMRDAVADLHSADELFSLWKPMSPICQFRRGEIGVGELPDVIVEVLSACREVCEMSLGWFDPWNISDGVDPTGYVKGWAAQRALRHFRRDWIGGTIVNAAGDVAVLGVASKDQPFQIGIVNPFDPSQICVIVPVSSALATSGTYERGEHLVVPFTHEARSAVASATVSGPNLGIADALATALAVGGRQALEVIDDIDGYEALMIEYNGTVSKTPQFQITETNK